MIPFQKPSPCSKDTLFRNWSFLFSSLKWLVLRILVIMTSFSRFFCSETGWSSLLCVFELHLQVSLFLTALQRCGQIVYSPSILRWHIYGEVSLFLSFLARSYPVFVLFSFSTGSWSTTIGIDFKMKTITLEGKKYKLQIWCVRTVFLWFFLWLLPSLYICLRFAVFHCFCEWVRIRFPPCHAVLSCCVILSIPCVFTAPLCFSLLSCWCACLLCLFV